MCACVHTHTAQYSYGALKYDSNTQMLSFQVISCLELGLPATFCSCTAQCTLCKKQPQESVPNSVLLGSLPHLVQEGLCPFILGIQHAGFTCPYGGWPSVEASGSSSSKNTSKGVGETRKTGNSAGKVFKGTPPRNTQAQRSSLTRLRAESRATKLQGQKQPCKETL